MRQQRWIAAAAVAGLLCIGAPAATQTAAAQTAAGTKETEETEGPVRASPVPSAAAPADMNGGTRVYLDEDAAIVVPGALMAEVEALLLHDDPSRVDAALRDLLARDGRRAPMLAEAIRRIVERRRPSRESGDEPDRFRRSPIASHQVNAGFDPAPAAALDEQRTSGASAFEGARALDARAAETPAGDGADPGHAAARLDRQRRAFAFRADPIRRAAPSGLLAPAVGAVGPQLAPVASPVRP